MCDKDKINDECEEFETEISLDTTFTFPRNLSEHYILGKYLVIAPEQANWLVCDDDEYAAFCIFRQGKSIQETEAQLNIATDRARLVVSRLIAQIIGKEFLQDAAITERSIFRIAALYLTDACNLRCSTCVWSCTVAGPNECTFHHWVKFMNAFKDIGGQVVVVTGGEPLLNHDCPKVIQHAKEIGLKVLLLTNGTLITNKNAKFLGENCDQIRVSIDGPNAKTHEAVRGKGTFEKAISALRELSPYSQCNLTIAMTPTPANIPSFQTNLRRFSKWVWKEISPNISFEVTGRLMEGRKVPRMSKPEKRAFRRCVCSFCNDQLGRDFIQKMNAVNVTPNRRAPLCGFSEKVSVLANGNVGVCIFAPGPLCNIKNMGDEGDKVFISNLAKKVRQLAESTSIENLYPCADCDIRYFCGGKCREENRADCGNPNICECDEIFRNEWYEELVRINSYVVEPL